VEALSRDDSIGRHVTAPLRDCTATENFFRSERPSTPVATTVNVPVALGTRGPLRLTPPPAADCLSALQCVNTLKA